jgi:hypothetical protein
VHGEVPDVIGDASFTHNTIVRGSAEPDSAAL